MPTIRIDEDVYNWLKSQAVPFEDTPNSVLRRLAKLNTKNNATTETKREKVGGIKMITTQQGNRQWYGKQLNDLWEVHARDAYYHKDGTWFENLRHFPGALFDANGYILFKTEEEYNNSPYLDIGQKLNVHHGISSIPGYKRMS